jgi:hypothetical protein
VLQASVRQRRPSHPNRPTHRRERPEGAWQDAATAIETESTLVEQPLKTQLEYRVIAINKSGEGQPSSTVKTFFKAADMKY